MRLTRHLDASFDRLAAAVPATIGAAVALPDLTYSLGRWSCGVAWSTIKVPLAIAALRRDPVRARNLVVRAVTESDNPASERLWSQLGEPADAARQVQAVVSEAGDTVTVVESRRLRPGFTAFGQTRWALADQARFAAHLPQLRDAAGVVDLMRQLVAGQRWGLAAKGVAAKGGWGPAAADGYLVRQFGSVPTDSGHLGVAVAAEAATFDTGVAALNAVAEWLFERMPQLAQQ
ncbi:hypothetical protein A5672_26335 [Mycobacterium alsense]|uniref:Serine hydrolase n=1 Tax=Mycobacterium alsense TaxID=324058 RepID=A0ABD6NYM2_9MYCO|nr:hypothetical protein A5672_26335 [Mycobacterium alsense]